MCVVSERKKEEGRKGAIDMSKNGRKNRTKLGDQRRRKQKRGGGRKEVCRILGQQKKTYSIKVKSVVVGSMADRVEIDSTRLSGRIGPDGKRLRTTVVLYVWLCGWDRFDHPACWRLRS